MNKDILRLARSEGLGNRGLYRLLSLYGSAGAVMDVLPELARKSNRKIVLCPLSKIEEEIELCENYGAQLVCFNDPRFSRILKKIEDCPPVLTVKGNLNLLNEPSFAIVGSRAASYNACRLAHQFASEIGARGLAIVSGLARGVDAYAHRGALSSGTIAVIAGGINHIYPNDNRDLYQQIAEQGLIVAELPFDAIPKANHFPQRNRIISGLSKGVLVVEASLKSGSLITANFALSHNRELFAVPGFPLDPRSRGTNNLIKKGANLTETIDDIFNNLLGESIETRQQEINFLQEHQEIFDYENNQILSLLSDAPVAVEDLQESTNLQISIILEILLELELADKIRRNEQNKFYLKF